HFVRRRSALVQLPRYLRCRSRARLAGGDHRARRVRRLGRRAPGLAGPRPLRPPRASGPRDTGAVDELLIESAAVLPAAGAEWIEAAAVLVRAGRVAEVGDAAELRRAHPQAERAGGSGHLVIPGLVNA